ncbi:MAG: radical family uncharacterized protein [Firmicutes bacterium]|nr:radical family uncharacterized protein [Bacillota bacterium]
MSWYLKESLQKTVAAEQGTLVYAPGSRRPMALVYPNTYHVGMSNLGLHIIYEQINSRGDTACERLFLPDKKTIGEYSRTNTPLLTLENQLPLYEFPLIAFAVSFEMDYFNLLTILMLGKVPMVAAERGEGDPLVIIGGPCATFNPEPLADFVDACIIGEGEEVMQDFLDSYYDSLQQGLPREELLLRLAQIEGVYVPRFYQPVYAADGSIERYERQSVVPAKVNRRYIKDLGKYPAQTVIVTSETEFKDMYLIEVARGCGRHCRFCMAGYCFRNPRVHSLAQIAESVKRAKLFKAKVGLMGASLTLSINPFIPKPFTPFQWLPMASMEEVSSSLKYIQTTLKKRKGVEVLIEQPKEAYIQSVLARGDRRLGQVLLTAVASGGVKGWKQALKAHKVDEKFYLYRPRGEAEVLPWDNLSMGFDKSYLLAEYHQAQDEKYTPPCSAGCKRCGVCQ